MENQLESIAKRLQDVKKTLNEALKKANRAPQNCTLVAVSKTKPVAAIIEAIAAGQKVFGENKVQEAMEKWPEIKAQHPDIKLHLIGPLQSNKARDAVQTFDVIETLDREKLARILKRIMDEEKKQVKIYIQVNTGEEEQKAGVKPYELDGFITLVRDEIGLTIAGLMCIPPVDEEPAMHFALLHKLAQKHGLEELSMGMSGDFAIAAQLGATSVRVGTLIFGAR